MTIRDEIDLEASHCPQCDSEVMEEPLKVAGKDWHQLCGARQAVDLLDSPLTTEAEAKECEMALARYVELRRGERAARERKKTAELRAMALDITSVMSRPRAI